MRGSNRDVCLHAAGPIRRSQTTGSMIARLAPEGATTLFTGTAAPCLSIFRPVAFAGAWSALTPENEQEQAPLWRRHEKLHRHELFDGEWRTALRQSRDQAEARIFGAFGATKPDPVLLEKADKLAAQWHDGRLGLLDQQAPAKVSRFWRKVPMDS
jgi:secernin